MVKMQCHEYDIILIGSGVGALTVASLMAQLRGKRVLILERHFVAGGFTHTFKRKGYQWDPGLHYVGQMEAGTSARNLFDLVTAQGVQWNKMPDPFEKFIYPGLTFELYSDPERYQSDLIQRFPSEEAAIRRYFRDLRKGAAALFLHAAQQNSAALFKIMGRFAKIWHRMDLTLTTQAYLDRHFRNPQLKALLTSQWLDYGLPPTQSPFVLHATIASHYLKGGYYPVGGPGTIANSVEAIVEQQGGKILVNREVSEILLDRGQAAGVRVRNLKAKQQPAFEEYYAPVVISNVGAVNTYLKLIPDSYPLPCRDRLRQFVQTHPPTTHVSLYLGLGDDPRKLGFQGENHWIYGTFDHNDWYRNRGKWLKDGQPLQVYLSFPSLKDPEAKKHTAEVLVLTDYEVFAQWRQQPWLHRDDTYQALKQQIQTMLLSLLERHYPGFTDLVDYCEVSTPITNEHFTAHPKGAMYGLPLVPERFQSQNQVWSRVRTPLPGLYMTGTDVYLLGIMGAIMGGLLTTSQLPDGISIPKVFAAAAQAQIDRSSRQSTQASVTGPDLC